MVRFIINTAVYIVLGFAMFALTGLLAGKPWLQVGVTVVGAALWSGTLTTLLELWAYRKSDASDRVAWGALLGALSVGGFTAALSQLAWGHLDPVLVPVGALLGGAMQGARAFASGTGLSETQDKMNAKQLIANGALVIDVRRPAEWDAGHLSTAKLVPVDELDTRIGEVKAWLDGDVSKPVVVYCHAGGRAGRAKVLLDNAGFTNVTNGGGYSGLK